MNSNREMIVNSAALKGSHIRSLSAPTIQVRKNRTSHLRKIFSVHNDDLSYLARPPKGETNPTVAGQNKSAATLNQKQIGLWFRERCYTVDKMEKYEDDIYSRLILIEKTKWKITHASAGPDRSASRSSQGASFPRIDSRSTGMVSRSRQSTYQMKTTNESNENDNTTIVDKTKADEGTTTKQVEIDASGKAAAASSVQIPVISVEQNPNDSESKPNEKTATDVKDVPMSVSVKHNNRRPATQQHNPSEARPTMSPRAATNGEGMLDSARRALDHPALPTPENANVDTIKPKTQGAFTFSKGVNRLGGEQTPQQSGSQISLDRKSMESLSKAKEIERKILNEPFTYWKKDNIGKLIKSDMPYKRRAFPLPVERNDDERRKKMLDKERRSKRDQMKRYRSLCDDLDELEKWNPLDDMRFIKDFEEKQKEKEEFDAQEKWRKLGMLRHWVKAFKTHEVKDIADLDPNSEEALQYCKYLRLKEKKRDTALTPAAEKEARKSSWNTVHTRKSLVK